MNTKMDKGHYFLLGTVFLVSIGSCVLLGMQYPRAFLAGRDSGLVYANLEQSSYGMHIARAIEEKRREEALDWMDYSFAQELDVLSEKPEEFEGKRKLIYNALRTQFLSNTEDLENLKNAKHRDPERRKVLMDVRAKLLKQAK